MLSLALADLMSSVENDTGLRSQHHPGDVLFEVTVEIKPKVWIPPSGSEFQKGLLESLKNHVSVGMEGWRKTAGMSQIFT